VDGGTNWLLREAQSQEMHTEKGVLCYTDSGTCAKTLKGTCIRDGGNSLQMNAQNATFSEEMKPGKQEEGVASHCQIDSCCMWQGGYCTP
jgi:hypothetical protein